MLVLSRKTNESIVIDGQIIVTVVEVRGDKVKLGIIAPATVPVHREEVFKAIQGTHSTSTQIAADPSRVIAKPTVAVIGASSDRRKFGNKSVRAHQAAGYEVYPVHPIASEVEGHKVYANVGAIPVPLDRVSIYLPAAAALTVLEEVAAVRPREVWLNPGADAPEVIARAQQLGLTVIPACSIVALGLRPGQFAD